MRERLSRSPCRGESTAPPPCLPTRRIDRKLGLPSRRFHGDKNGGKGTHRGVILAITASLLVCVAQAEERFSQPHLRRLLRSKIEGVQELAANPSVLQAVKEQNERNVPLERTREIDRQWTATSELTEFKRSLQENAVGRYLKSMVTFNESIYSEAFLTDRNGATIAAYPVTSDYWQGDETKWIEAYNKGKGKVYVGPIRFDESTQTDSVQICVPVMADGEAIGVLTVGVKLTYLQAQYLKSLR